MEQGSLSNYFTGIAIKRLSAVEANPNTSNQHEFNGVTRLRQIFGGERNRFSAKFIYLGQYEDQTKTVGDFLTWYDARERNPERTEFRLYYPTNIVSSIAEEGDLLVIGKRPDNTVLVVIAQANTTAENNILWLFNQGNEQTTNFSVRDFHGEQDIQLNFVSRLILEELEIEITDTDVNYLPLLLDKFGESFPSTRVFSAFAREMVTDFSSLDNPDQTYMAWIEQEEILFRTFERHLVEERIRDGFTENGSVDVDDFLSFSLRVQNRRKSRVGYALENHLEQIFVDHHITYTRGGNTENRSKPDFIFPNIRNYQDEAFPTNRLSMLGVKSTCKDRWRQVLSEAARITEKHLFTLEPGISVNQTDEMKAKSLQLVLPEQLHLTYQNDQRLWLMNLSEFLELARERQTG